MQRIQLEMGLITDIVPTGTVEDQFLSLEGGPCRLFTGHSSPTDKLAGHLISGGYQVIVPAGVQVWALLEPGASGSIITSDFGL